MGLCRLKAFGHPAIDKENLMKRTCIIIVLALLSLATLASQANATKHFVNQVGVTFVPSELTIIVGDEVEWDWSSGSHTVTNGTGPTDPNVGALFDALLTSANDSFSFHFDQTGDFPYFCRPHFSVDMTGIIHVTPDVSAEGKAWGQVKSLYR